MKIPTAFLLLSIFLTPLFAAPRCCDLESDCIQSHRASTGEYRIGPTLTTEEVNECGRGGRANWCVALWTNGRWYCTSPGYFLDHVSGYARQCEGGVFPTAGRKVPCFGAGDCRCNDVANEDCNVALNALQSITRRLARPSRRCVVAVNNLKCE